MSELLAQHQDWSPRRARLWGKPQPAVRELPPAVVVEPPDVVPAEIVARPKRRVRDIMMEAGDDVMWRVGVRLILAEYGETMRRLVSHQRDQHIIECRHAVASYLRERGWSYPRIGEVMNRDHSSIVHLLNPQKRQETYRAKREAANG